VQRRMQQYDHQNQQSATAHVHTPVPCPHMCVAPHTFFVRAFTPTAGTHQIQGMLCDRRLIGNHPALRVVATEEHAHTQHLGRVEAKHAEPEGLATGRRDPVGTPTNTTVWWNRKRPTRQIIQPDNRVRVPHLSIWRSARRFQGWRRNTSRAAMSTPWTSTSFTPEPVSKPSSRQRTRGTTM